MNCPQVLKKSNIFWKKIWMIMLESIQGICKRTSNIQIWRYHCLREVVFLKIWNQYWLPSDTVHRSRGSEVFVHLPCPSSKLVYRSLESTLVWFTVSKKGVHLCQMAVSNTYGARRKNAHKQIKNKQYQPTMLQRKIESIIIAWNQTDGKCWYHILVIRSA